MTKLQWVVNIVCFPFVLTLLLLFLAFKLVFDLFDGALHD